MSLRNTFILMLPGYFQMKSGRFIKGFFIAFLFFMNFFLYVIATYRQREASLFVFLTLATVLFYLLDVVEKWPDAQLEEVPVANAYEEARIAMLTFDYAQAEKLFHQALRNDPQDMDVLFQLAVLYHKKGDIAKARTWLKKYLKQKRHTKWIPDAENLLGELDSDSSSA